jgi:ABC-2 type transport system ATP-binding protein
MRILTGNMPASEGSARVSGFDVLEDSIEVRRRVGYLPENVPLYPERSVVDTLSFVADLKGVPRRGKTRALGEIMERCGLAEVGNRTVGRLSRGFRQRVGLAQALVGDPPVLVLDEPTVGLDPAQVVEVRGLIKSLAGERTVILSTHILPEVSQLCTRILIINKGRIAADGTPEELEARLKAGQAYRVRVGGDIRRAATLLKAVPGILSAVSEPEDGSGGLLRVEADGVQDVRGAMAKALIDGGSELLELSAAPMSLEEIFLSLVREETPGSVPP